MHSLTIIQGPRQGERLPLSKPQARIGRDDDADVRLVSHLVSRNHALLTCTADGVLVEDLGSRNGTYVNGTKITRRVALTPSDQLVIGDFVLGLTAIPSDESTEAKGMIREQVEATLGNEILFTQNPAHTLHVVLEITQALSTTPDVKPLLDNFLGRLFVLFPRADRGLILLADKDELVVQVQMTRRAGIETDFPFSRTIVKKSLKDGVGILSDDLGNDVRFSANQSIRATETRSMMCVPLIARGDRRLGVVQLEQTGSFGLPFTGEDLRLLTTIALQVAVVLDNAEASEERLRNEVVRKELAVARNMQMSYLPTDFAPRPGFQPFACIQPARDFSGDLYDFFPLADGRFAFFVGDVSGKGLPAALFMVAVRTLTRHLAPTSGEPAAALARLNDALAADNPSMMFVTLTYGVYEPATGTLDFASAGHPPPLLLRKSDVTEIDAPAGRVLGYSLGKFELTNVRLTLELGDTLIFYSDGITEAFGPDGEAMFGVEGLTAALEKTAGLPLTDTARRVHDAVRRFCGNDEIQDDQTLFLLRRL